jgi:hypothetical protein
VPAQQGQLDVDGLFVTAQEGLAVPGGQADDFPAGRPLPGADGGAGKSGIVLVVGEHQQRTPDAGGRSDRADSDIQSKRIGL